ncbi:F-box domain-containing protein [Rhynchospora pubera]|uniref:F-box domain-containing protein n=1 Tax=Rhynchospora pubera TaxID=906938 RepID=A0AAV8D028_9POAL|nr:F-box domain-containing protein [Rhynchospora pubera]
MPRQWAELHPDLLRHIYTKLYDPVDFICFRAVCKGWCTGAPPSERPPQFPLLLERNLDHKYSSEFKLYSLPTGKTYSLQLPEAQNKMFFGQLEDYLVTFGAEDHDCSPALLNPFTRTELLLPFYNSYYFIPLYIGTTDPIRNPDSVVMLVYCPKRGHCIGFWNKNEDDWGLRGDSCLQRIIFSGPVVCHKGRLLFIGYSQHTIYKCRLYAIDLTTGGKLFDVGLPSQMHHFDCLVNAPTALLAIEQHNLYSDGVPLEECWFEVYQLEEGEYPPHWTKLSNIGDLMIFLNSYNGFCVSADGFNGIRENCIYFTKLNGNEHNSRRLIGRYELGEERSEVVGLPRDTNGTWIVPNV